MATWFEVPWNPGLGYRGVSDTRMPLASSLGTADAEPVEPAGAGVLAKSVQARIGVSLIGFARTVFALACVS